MQCSPLVARGRAVRNAGPRRTLPLPHRGVFPVDFRNPLPLRPISPLLVYFVSSFPRSPLVLHQHRYFATSLCVLRSAILHRCVALWHCTLAALCGPRHITSPSLLHFDIAMLLAQCRESHGQTQWALPALLPCCWLNVVSPMGRHDGCIQPYCQFASCRSHVVSPMGRHDDDHFLPVRFVSGLRNTSLLLHPHPPCPRNTSLLLPVPLCPAPPLSLSA